MAALREQLEGVFAAPESFDPEDADSFGDATSARAKKRAQRSAGSTDMDLAPGKGRLRLRAPVPDLPGYTGSTVSRRDAFGEADVDAPATRVKKKRKRAAEDEDSFPIVAPSDDDGEEFSAGIGGVSAGGFSISNELEQDYEKMMSRTQHELQVMRRPPEAEVARRREEALALKSRLEAWKALVELRIHFEGCLSIGHRLPAASASRTTSSSDAAAAEVAGLLGSLLALQERLAEQSGVRVAEGDGAPRTGGLQHEEERRTQAAAWSFIDARVQSVLDWGIGVADEWKEKTRLDARRSFKVLDQSFRTQMQAVAETEPAKLRRRSTPPPGRHKILGAAEMLRPQAISADGGDAEGDASAVGPEQVTCASRGEEEQDIFDDRDFYVSLLREVLADSAGGKDALAGEDASARELRDELQGRRANKKKVRNDVERRASKGRKIRYVPIEKLQNFMAPQPRMAGGGLDAGLLSSGAATVDALLRSLFA